MTNSAYEKNNGDGLLYSIQVFYDKFLCDKFYLLVCTRNFDKFFYDKCTCSKASMLAFEQVHLS
jgi:hypothetical protein